MHIAEEEFSLSGTRHLRLNSYFGRDAKLVNLIKYAYIVFQGFTETDDTGGNNTLNLTWQ